MMNMELFAVLLSIIVALAIVLAAVFILSPWLDVLSRNYTNWVWRKVDKWENRND